MFQFPRLPDHIGLPELTPWGVAPFGNLRINACWAAPRSISSPDHVLHRLLAPRHPPYAGYTFTRIAYSSPAKSKFIHLHLLMYRFLHLTIQGKTIKPA